MATRTLPLVDRALGGTLEARLRKGRSEGLTHAEIAEDLAAEVQIVVSRETVRKWCHELGIEAS